LVATALDLAPVAANSLLLPIKTTQEFTGFL